MELTVTETTVYLVSSLKNNKGEPHGTLVLGVYSGTPEDILEYINNLMYTGDYKLTLSEEDIIFEEQILYSITPGG